VIGIEGGNAEHQKFRIRVNFRAQVNVLPVAKLFHDFAKCGIGLKLDRSEHQNWEKITQKLGDGARPPILELKQGLRPLIVQRQNFPPKPVGGADIRGQILNFGPDFLKTCELWSTYFSILGKPSRRNTRHQNIVGQSTKTKKLWGVKFWRWFWFSRNWRTLVHTFWCFWKALGKGYKPPKFCGPKFRNKKVIERSNFELWSRFSQNCWTLVHIFRNCCKVLKKDYKAPKYSGPKFKNKKVIRGQILTMISIFSKLVNFGPNILMFLESPREGLQACKILWAKVQKQQSYEPKTLNLWGVWHFGGPKPQKMLVDPWFFSSFLEVLWTF